MAKWATPLCCLVLVVVVMGAGASAQQATCSTSASSALVQDAASGLANLAGSYVPVLCLTCKEDRGCSVLEEYQTAQLKLCGKCYTCVPKPVVVLGFQQILQNCVKETDDGEARVSGKIPSQIEDLDIEFVMEGKEVDAGIGMKLSE